MPEDVKAQITGTVWKIVVKRGEEVEEGDDGLHDEVSCGYT